MSIILLKDGPIFINEPLTIDGETMEKVALCRCGTSQNKPFCDGSHEECDFKAEQKTIKLE